MAKGVDSLLQEFNELKVTCPTVEQLKHTSFDRNLDKNRYKGLCSGFSAVLLQKILVLDIICVEDTRVVLTWPPTMQNYVSFLFLYLISTSHFYLV